MKNDLTFELRFLQYALLTVDSWPECFAFLGMPYHSANQLLGCRSKTSSQIPLVQYHVDSRFGI